MPGTAKESRMSETVSIKFYDDLAKNLNRVEKERDKYRKKSERKTQIIEELRETQIELIVSVMIQETRIQSYFETKGG